MNRAVKIRKKADRKSESQSGKEGGKKSRRACLEQIHRNVKGALSQLEQLLAAEKEQAGEN